LLYDDSLIVFLLINMIDTSLRTIVVYCLFMFTMVLNNECPLK